MIDCVVQAAAGRIPVIAGAGSNCTREAVSLAQNAERIGADAILTITPTTKTAARGPVSALQSRARSLLGTDGIVQCAQPHR